MTQCGRMARDGRARSGFRSNHTNDQISGNAMDFLLTETRLLPWELTPCMIQGVSSAIRICRCGILDSVAPRIRRAISGFAFFHTPPRPSASGE